MILNVRGKICLYQDSILAIFIFDTFMMLKKRSVNNEFISAPWCLNGHVHTILCSLLFKSSAGSYERINIDTPDGDFLTLDLYLSAEHRGVVLLLHGLEGHSRRYYITRLAGHLKYRGFSVVALNYRSCGGEMNRRKKFYHSGETEDLETAIRWINEQFQGIPLHAAGFSLGASSLLNFLRENGKDHTITSAVAISTPFELKKGSLNLENGFNRVYSHRFLATLREKLNRKKRVHPDLPDFMGNTLYEFDDRITGPIHGFEGADHYYESCSAAFFMDKIKTPLLVIHSKEDPLCPFRFTPLNAIEKNSFIEACFTERGGHVGFWSLPPGWLNRSVADYFLEF